MFASALVTRARLLSSCRAPSCPAQVHVMAKMQRLPSAAGARGLNLPHPQSSGLSLTTYESKRRYSAAGAKSTSSASSPGSATQKIPDEIRKKTELDIQKYLVECAKKKEDKSVKLGAEDFFKLYRKVIEHPFWVVSGVLNAENIIQELHTFKIKGESVLPIFSSEARYNEFYELLTKRAIDPSKTPPRAHFTMSGVSLFTQLAPASDMTNVKLIVFDILQAPAFTIDKPNLESWRGWGEIVQMERFYQLFNEQYERGQVTPTDMEAVVKATLRFPHFFTVKEKASGEILTFDLNPKKSPLSSLKRGKYLAIYTALDRIGPYLDRNKFVVERVDPKTIFDRCVTLKKEQGIVVNCVSAEYGPPLAILNLATPLPGVAVQQTPSHRITADRKTRADSEEVKS